MRLFLAIDFNQQTKNKIQDLQSELRLLSKCGRWKHMDNFHLTLKFLDEVSDESLKLLDDVLYTTIQGTNKFAISIKNISVFRDEKKNIKVLWLGLKGELTKLNALVQRIQDGLEKIGYKKETRKYTPHITVGQDVILKANFGELATVMNRYTFDDYKVEKIILMRSEQINDKRVYTPLKEYYLI